MEKEICRRHLSRGCVWMFMSMFDFKHGGSNHKLLMDKKHGSKRIIGIETKVEKQLTCDCDCEKKSVKKLIEEEIDEKTHHKCDAECRPRRSRTCSKSSEDINVLIAGDDDDQCPRISADSINEDSEETFSELIKRMIAQKERETESCNKFVEDSQRIKETSSSNESRQKIVVLKPEPDFLDLGSSHKAKTWRFGSRFILSRIRRRLKSAKNPCNAQHDSDLDPDPDALSSNMSQNSIETSSGRNVSDGEILPDISSKSEADKEETINDSEDSKKSMCGMYIAAKKHLSEMLAEGDTDVDLPDKEVPRILGKILALPEFSTPESSPRVTLTHGFVGHQLTEKPRIQQCSSEESSDTLGLDLNKHEETASTSDMPVPGDMAGLEHKRGVSDTGKEEKAVQDSLSPDIFSIIHQDAYVDEEKFETHDEHERTQPLEKSQETFEPCSPPSSSVKMSECQDNTTDVPGKSSPVSVLEPFFTDDDTSPNSSRFSSVEMRLQPLCIRFDEPDSPRPNNDVKATMNDKELALAYIQDVLKSSDLNWEELLSRSFYSDQLLEQALMDDIDFSCNDKKLLFDCINEVLVEFCGHDPWISFAKPSVRFCPDMEVVQEEVYWHLLPLPSPHTLDQIVRKDLARTGNWMDLRFDIGCIGSETGEVIFDELLEEIISSFTDLFQSTKPQSTS